MTDNPEPDAPSASPRAPEPPPILVALHPPDADAAGHQDRDQVSLAFQPRRAHHSLMTSIIRA
jgi:hypothetical protein